MEEKGLRMNVAKTKVFKCFKKCGQLEDRKILMWRLQEMDCDKLNTVQNV